MKFEWSDSRGKTWLQRNLPTLFRPSLSTSTSKDDQKAFVSSVRWNRVSRAMDLIHNAGVDPNRAKIPIFYTNKDAGYEPIVTHCLRNRQHKMLSALIDTGAVECLDQRHRICRGKYGREGSHWESGGYITASVLLDNEKGLDLLLNHIGDLPSDDKEQALSFAVSEGKTPFVRKLLAANATPTMGLLQDANRKGYGDIALELEEALASREQQEKRPPEGPGYTDRPAISDITLGLKIGGMSGPSRQRLFNHLAGMFSGEMQGAVNRQAADTALIGEVVAPKPAFANNAAPRVRIAAPDTTTAPAGREPAVEAAAERTSLRQTI